MQEAKVYAAWTGTAAKVYCTESKIETPRLKNSKKGFSHKNTSRISHLTCLKTTSPYKNNTIDHNSIESCSDKSSAKQC